MTSTVFLLRAMLWPRGAGLGRAAAAELFSPPLGLGQPVLYLLPHLHDLLLAPLLHALGDGLGPLNLLGTCGGDLGEVLLARLGSPPALSPR